MTLSHFKERSREKVEKVTEKWFSVSKRVSAIQCLPVVESD